MTASAEPHGRAPAPEVRVQRLVWAVLAVTLAAVVALGGGRLLVKSRGDTLPILGSVPAFTLVERSGATVSTDDLAGRVWIADFIFTRCGGTCPVLSTRLAELLRRLDARGVTAVSAVSFTVDPTHDDPATLRRYAERFGADATRWLFLTGDRDAVTHLVRDGFHLSIAELPEGERERSPEPITHSNRFVLVDTQLRIRGYYHGTEADGVADLERDVARLVGGVAG